MVRLRVRLSSGAALLGPAGGVCGSSSCWPVVGAASASQSTTCPSFPPVPRVVFRGSVAVVGLMKNQGVDGDGAVTRSSSTKVKLCPTHGPSGDPSCLIVTDPIERMLRLWSGGMAGTLNNLAENNQSSPPTQDGSSKDKRAPRIRGAQANSSRKEEKMMRKKEKTKRKKSMKDAKKLKKAEKKSSSNKNKKSKTAKTDNDGYDTRKNAFWKGGIREHVVVVANLGASEVTGISCSASSSSSSASSISSSASSESSSSSSSPSSPASSPASFFSSSILPTATPAATITYDGNSNVLVSVPPATAVTLSGGGKNFRVHVVANGRRKESPRNKNSIALLVTGGDDGSEKVEPQREKKKEKRVSRAAPMARDASASAAGDAYNKQQQHCLPSSQSRAEFKKGTNTANVHRILDNNDNGHDGGDDVGRGNNTHDGANDDDGVSSPKKINRPVL